MGRRICLIGPVDNTHVQRWAHGLMDAGERVSILSTVPAPMDGALRDVPLVALPTAAAGMSRAARLATLLRGWARVPALIAALRPDVVHLHSLPTPAAVPFLRLVRPLVVSAWGSDVVQRDARKARLYPWLLDSAAAVTATSRYLADVTATYLRRPRPIAVVPFGVDVERFRPGEMPPQPGVVGTLRHLERTYGVDVLLAAVARAERVAELRIGGGGSQADRLVRQARELEIAARVRWYGRVPHAGVPAFLQELAVFANPSRAESFGVAALEAQACGVPVVASRVGGLPEVVQDGATGLLVPPDDPTALAAALDELLGDQAQCRRMGAAAREWVATRYPWPASVALMRAVYDEVDAMSGKAGKR